MKFIKPSEEELKQNISEVAGKGGTDNWMEKILAAMQQLLLKHPIRYRSHGPYWWPLKKIFIDRGLALFGDNVDREWLEEVDYGEAALNIMAAQLYSDIRFDTGLIDDPFHTLESEGGDALEFGSNDPRMEMMTFTAS